MDSLFCSYYKKHDKLENTLEGSWSLINIHFKIDTLHQSVSIQAYQGAEEKPKYSQIQILESEAYIHIHKEKR